MGVLDDQKRNAANAEKAAAYDKMNSLMEREDLHNKSRDQGIQEAVQAMVEQMHPVNYGFAQSVYAPQEPQFEAQPESYVDYSAELPEHMATQESNINDQELIAELQSQF